ncbi:hypothetical protein N9966_00830 [bacterium]|nr:hypothetical protein [bacterium]
MGGSGKIANISKPNVNTSGTIYSSGLYYGKVVAVDSDSFPGEGLIKINLPSFDKNNKVFCKKNGPKSLLSSVVKLQRKQGSGQGVIGGDNLNVDITNQTQVDQLTNKPETTATKKETNDSCTEVPWAFPFLPKNIQILPKVGEMCLVFVEDIKKPQLNRYWVGSLISQKSKLGYESSASGGSLLNKNVVPGSSRTLNDDISKKGGFTGGFPEKFDVSLMGRSNADIVLPTSSEGKDRLNRDGEVLIRAGKFKFNNLGKLELNTKNPGFLRIKTVNRFGDFESTTTHSMLYSDYISLVSYKNSDGSSGVPFIREINPLLETDRELFRFHDALSPLIRGDRLVTFLELLVDYVKNHNHPYPKLPATNANSKPELEKFDLNSLLSTHIRIN